MVSFNTVRNTTITLFLRGRINDHFGIKVDPSVYEDLGQMGTVYTMALNEVHPIYTDEILIGSMKIPSGIYLFVLNSIARSSATLHTDLAARYNGAMFLQGRIPNTNGTHINLCMTAAVWLPDSNITFFIKREDTTGEVAFFGGQFIAIRLR